MLRTVRRHRQVQRFLRFTIDFLEHTNIHGLRHFIYRGQHWWQLLFWMLLFLGVNIYFHRIRGKLIALYEKKNTGIETDMDYVHFASTMPAFTFCSEPVLDEDEVSKLIEQYPKNQHKDIRYFFEELISIKMGSPQMLPLGRHKFQPKDFMQHIVNLTKTSIVFNDHNERGAAVMNDGGICYTFNCLISDVMDLSLYSNLGTPRPESNQTPSTFDLYSTFPIRFGFKHNFIKNTKLFIHSPYTLPPSWSNPYILLAPGRHINIGIEMLELTYTKDLLSTPIKNRKCRMSNESNLVMYPNRYSRHLCLTNCRASFAMKKCRCLPHFYANRAMRDIFPSYEVCDIVGLNCLAVQRNWQYGATLKACQCLPECAGARIDTFMTTDVLDHFNKTTLKWAHVEVGLPFPPKMQLRHRIYYTITDYYVSLGGFLALLMGCSLLSPLETIYYFTIRLFWYIRGYRGTVN